MRKILSSLVCLAACLFVWAGRADAAEPRVLVLPFAVNAPSAQSQLARDVPALVRQALEAHGVTAIPTSASGKSAASDAASAKKRARSARAGYAVFGSLNQLGEGFSLDVQMVSASSSGSRAYHMQGANLLELQPVVDSLVGQMVLDFDATSSVRTAAKSSRGGIADIEVRGLKFIDKDRVLVRVGTRTGDPVDEDRIDEDVRNIWDLGYFDDVSADVETSAAGPVLIFTVAEKPRIAEVRVEGSEAVKIGDITEAMSTHTDSVLNEKVLAEDLQKVTDLYHKQGFYLAEVTYEVQPRADGVYADGT